mmetsp:Transcript_43005/g.98825  ORF Transcript_43005/g.98825 Transcript_43005/m.98825 type:complete len:389 (-) Transcript_43005:57-1223(-)
MLQLRLCVAGNQFEVEVDAAATTADVKIAATAGCDIDPDVMRIIFKGKVLGEESVLEACGIKSGDSLHIARGAAATGKAASASVEPAATFQLIARLGGVDKEIDGLKPGDSVCRTRGLVAEQLEVQPDSIHLIYKGRILKDEETLESNDVKGGSVLRVAKRAVSTAEGAQQATASAAQLAQADEPMSSAMPMAWDGSVRGQQLQQIGQALFDAGGNQPQLLQAMQGLMQTGGSQQQRQMLEGLVGNMQQMQAAQAQAAQREVRQDYHARLEREVRHMDREVRALIEEQQGADFVVDNEMLAEISRPMAEARARGAPVPNPASFVEAGVTRVRQRREREARFAREANGLDPDVEDALADAEHSQAVAARMPRRLGGAPRDSNSRADRDM